MNDDLDKQLCESYPKLFKHVKGTDHSDGWFNLVDAACRRIQHHVDWKRKTEPFAGMSDEEFDEIHQPVVAQVKEKFGGLRFYVDSCDDYTRGVVDMAESMSYRTCEYCGSTGHKTGTGWIKTLCESCDKERKNG
jgi:hypothetical protein